jgi:hypothetical protein
MNGEGIHWTALGLKQRHGSSAATSLCGRARYPRGTLWTRNRVMRHSFPMARLRSVRSVSQHEAKPVPVSRQNEERRPAWLPGSSAAQPEQGAMIARFREKSACERLAPVTVQIVREGFTALVVCLISRRVSASRWWRL